MAIIALDRKHILIRPLFHSLAGSEKRSQCAVSEKFCGDALPDDIWPQFQKEAFFGNDHTLLVFSPLSSSLSSFLHHSFCIFLLPTLIVLHSSCNLSTFQYAPAHPVPHSLSLPTLSKKNPHTHKYLSFKIRATLWCRHCCFSSGSVSPGDLFAVC